MGVQIGSFTVVGEHEEGPGIRLLPHTHGDAYPWWSESTRNVLDALRPEDVAGKRVLDFGCGASAILGLAAASLGAALVAYAESHPALWAIAQRQIEANGWPVVADDGGTADFILANLGDAVAVGELSRRSLHGLGTDKEGQVIRW
jgi:predicted nicotinamide N-methyase